MNTNMEQKENKKKQLFGLSKDVFSGLSTSYKQKIVYDLLNLIKGNKKEEFMFKLLRHLNANTSKANNSKISNLCDELFDYFALSTDKEFSDFSYSIIIGIMGSKNLEVSQNG